MSKVSKKSPVTVRGSWFAMPIAFLRSRACAELSPQALKMLIDLCAQLGPNARGNGDLSAPPTTMEPRGWTSRATRAAALQDLLDTRLIIVTRKGNRRLCVLYAVTLWPIDCNVSKLDHGPGSYSVLDWEQDGAAAEPSIEHPATWRTLRKNAKSVPATGQPPLDIAPPRGNPAQQDGPYSPATGTQPTISGQGVAPPRVTFLDTTLSAGSSKPLGVDVKSVSSRRPSARKSAAVESDSTVGGTPEAHAPRTLLEQLQDRTRKAAT